MTHFLHVSCSPRGQASESLRLSEEIISHLREEDTDLSVVRRVLGGTALPFIDEHYATSQQSVADVSAMGSATQSNEWIGEVEQAKALVIATPMHNFMVPAALKLWIDHIARVRRTFEVTSAGKVGLLRDRPVFIAVSSGGLFSGESARQPDFLTPYLKAVLGMVGLRDVSFFAVQGTAFGAEAVAAAREAASRAIRDYFAAPLWKGKS